jgi:hypothetical protein
MTGLGTTVIAYNKTSFELADEEVGQESFS